MVLLYFVQLWVNFFIYALIFSLLGSFKEYITFAIGFCVLRVYSGGYHSETFCKMFCNVIIDNNFWTLCIKNTISLEFGKYSI